jgi:hypothetical protein
MFMDSDFPRRTPGLDGIPVDNSTYPYPLFLIGALYERKCINVSAGPWPIAQIGYQCSLVIHPEAFNPDGTLSTACQKFLINTVQHAVRQTEHGMCIVWGQAACTYVKARSTTLSIETNER